MLRFLIAATISSATIFPMPAHAQEPVYIIRHGEKEVSEPDPRLTAAGRERAAKWSDMVRLAEIDVVITSNAKRTRETGEIIAEQLTVPQKQLPANDVAGVIDLIQFDHEDDTVLVVGHAETIPSILSALGVTDPVEVNQDDFANMFIVTAGAEGVPRLLRLVMP
jgi:phosphohistidine phosphatase SixA